MVFVLPRHRAPTGQDESAWIEIRYSYVLGYNWIECGISRVNNFLSALGFNAPQQVTAMCAATNIFSLFAADDWIRTFINAEDRKSIYGAPLKIAVSFLPNYASATNPILKDGARNPNYNDFFSTDFYISNARSKCRRQTTVYQMVVVRERNQH